MAVSEAPAQEDVDEKPKRLRFTGRIGKEPRFSRRRQDNKAQLVFDVAVKEEGDEQTTWHTVWVYDQKAEQLQGELQQGQEVFVVGYPKTWMGKDPRTGKPKEFTGLNAAVVKPVRKEESRQ